jgi:hypothetical protein
MLRIGRLGRCELGPDCDGFCRCAHLPSVMAHHDPDILITRIIDSRDTAADWNAFEAFAAADPGMYRELALAQRDHRLLCAQMRAQSGVAEYVSAPVHMLHRDGAHPRSVRIEEHLVGRAVGAGVAGRGTTADQDSASSRRLRPLATWSGWAAAAVLTLAVIGRGGPQVNNSPSLSGSGALGSGASVLPIGTPETITAGLTFDDAQSALNAYLAQGKQDGRVITQQPMRILAMEQLPDGGGYRLVYERPIIESAIVSRPYGLNASGSDDPSSPTRLRMEPLRMTPRERQRGEIQ